MKRIGKLAIILSVVMALIIPTAAEAKSKSSSHISSHKVSTKKTNPNHGTTHSVKGYTKKNGTKVAPHQKTYPNKTKKDNLRYSSKSKKKKN
jgi:hypothetical protein